jgi:hypothetical protein
MWLMQIIESLFDVEVESLERRYAAGLRFSIDRGGLAIMAGLALVTVIVIVIDSSLWQPPLYASLGILLALLLPADVRFVPIIFGVATAIGGCFFELFCTGQIHAGVVLWTYIDPTHSLLRLGVSAFLGYFGTGAVLAGVCLLGLKAPLLARQRILAPHPGLFQGSAPAR